MQFVDIILTLPLKLTSHQVYLYPHGTIPCICQKVQAGSLF